MRLVKGVVFIFLAIVLGSCFNPPEFPLRPEIEFESLAFKKVGGFADPDSLILTISFNDGDGDLGLDPENPQYSSFPFHPINYYLAKDGDTTKISTEKRDPNLPPLIKIDAGQSGKLVTVRTRNDPQYSYLPPYSCSDYNFDSVYVSAENKSIFDKTYNIVDSLKSNQFPTVYILLDTFYYEFNPNHYNITVDFEIKNANGTYTPFYWRKELCETFDGRFPVLSEDNNVPLDGTLRYAMKSTGFIPLFGGKTLRLKVHIKDRALRYSNTVYTNDIMIN